jgi:hypothetical protein
MTLHRTKSKLTDRLKEVEKLKNGSQDCYAYGELKVLP